MNGVYIVLPFLQFAVSLFLASVVAFSDPRDRRNFLFVLFLLAMALWGITIFGMRDAFPQRALAYSWEKVALAAIPFSTIFFYHFVIAYTNKRSRYPVLLAFYALGVASAALSLSGQSVIGMEEKFYGFAPRLGWAFPILLLASYPPVALAFYDLTRTLRNELETTERMRVRTLRIGLVVSVLGGTSDFLPSLGLSVYPMGVLGNLLFAVITTYAVTRYRLMNLRLVLRRGLAYIAISSLIFAIYGAAYGFVWVFARNLSLPAAVITAIGAVILVGVFVQPLMTKAQAVVDRMFYRERLDRLEALSRLHETSKDIADLEALAANIVDLVRRAAQSDWVAILLPDRRGDYLATAADSRDPPVYAALPKRGCVATWLLGHESVLKSDYFVWDPYLQAMGEEERAALSGSGVAMLIPLIVKDSLTGIMAIGPRLVGSGYSAEDVSFLCAVADQAAVAVENARLYAQAQRDARQRAALAELGRVVSSNLDLEGVFERCAEQVHRLIPWDRFVITTVDFDRGTLANAYVAGAPVPGREQGSVQPIAGSTLEPAIRNQTGVISDTGRTGGVSGASPSFLASMLAVPLLSSGRVIGTMNLESTRSGEYTAAELLLAEQASAQIASAIANSQLYERTLQLAKERELRVRLDAENRELHRLNETKSKFVSTVSHELKTPLTSVIMFSDILLRNRPGNLQERQLEHLQVIKRNGRRLNMLIDDLLDVSRIDAGTLRLAMSDFDVRSLFEELRQIFAPIFASKRQTLSVSLPDENVWVRADRDRMIQVLSNFLSNASKYSPDGSEVEIRAWERRGRLHVTVRDQGIGISKEDQRKLFTAFFRAGNKETQAVPGTGLGLMIAKNIITLHDGQVAVDSEPGKGTCVRFYISKVVKQPDDAETEAWPATRTPAI